MKTKKAFMLAGLSAVLLSFNSCKKDADDHNEEELITTIKLKFTEVGSSTSTTFTFKDIDGPGGAAPTLNETITLAPSKQYNCEISVLNESVSPAEDITPEIITEAIDHQFYFEPTGVGITVSNLSTDSRGLPLGITSRWATGSTLATGTVKLTLKHKPGVKAAGDPVSKGETDIEVNFGARIQ